MGLSMVRQISDKLSEYKPQVQGRFYWFFFGLNQLFTSPCISVRRAHVSSVLAYVCIPSVRSHGRGVRSTPAYAVDNFGVKGGCFISSSNQNTHANLNLVLIKKI